MSEEFDKEAEREKLREKFEREEENRQATEHMSQLLLQGATMTNRHCDDCGDPIFRHDGQEFCPTCEKPVTSADQQEPTPQQAQTDTEAAPADQSDVADADDVDQPAGMTPDPAAHGQTTSSQPPEQDSRSTPGQSQPQPQPQSQSQPQPQTDSQHSQSHPQQSATPSVSHSGEIGEARMALVRRITALAREAEATEDLQRTRRLFEAVHEGADALAALNRSDDR